jgi:hypothetical protein
MMRSGTYAVKIDFQDPGFFDSDSSTDTNYTIKSGDYQYIFNKLAYAGFGGHGNMDLMERKRKDERTAKI